MGRLSSATGAGRARVAQLPLASLKRCAFLCRPDEERRLQDAGARKNAVLDARTARGVPCGSNSASNTRHEIEEASFDHARYSQSCECQRGVLTRVCGGRVTPVSRAHSSGKMA